MVILILVGGIARAQETDADVTIDDIVALGTEQLQPQSAHALIQIKNVSNGRTETELLLEGYGTFNDGIKLLIVFHRPKAVRNTRFLALIPNDKPTAQWIYLPSIRKSQRIVGSGQDASFMGTELLFSDIAKRDYDQFEYTYEGEEIINGENTWIMHIVSKGEWAYGSSREWISKESFFPIRVDFYDDAGALVKTSRTTELRYIDGYWVPIYTEITNEATKRKTIITIQELEYNINIPDRYFSVAYLKQRS